MKKIPPTRIALSIGVAAALVLALGCGSSRRQPTPSTTLSFVNSGNLATNEWPQSVAEGDFNGDGNLDLAVPTYGGADVNILLGDGLGAFTPGQAFPLSGDEVNFAVAADFNGDGKVDLAITVPDTSTDNVRILLGNGDGTFIAGSSMTLSDGGYFIASGDFNNDGKVDLVLVQGDITILLGNGDGTFRTGTTIAGFGTFSLVVGDFNRDGNLDLAAVGAFSGTMTVLLGDGRGSFSPASPSSYIGSQPGSIIAGDFNGDGIPDLAVTNEGGSGSVVVLFGKGDGTFTPATLKPITGSSIATADFLGNGRSDLVVVDPVNNTVSVFLANEDGTFAAPSTVPADTDGIGIAVGDFNRDGTPDLAIANNNPGSVMILLAHLTP
jgi:hypothetical protein